MSLSNFSAFALTRTEMKNAKGGINCTFIVAERGAKDSCGHYPKTTYWSFGGACASPNQSECDNMARKQAKQYSSQYGTKVTGGCW